MSTRNPWLDQIKALACLAIVGHHLAFYGPMADAVRPALPALIGWLDDYGRMAVQVFLVLGGYFAAAAIAPHGIARQEAFWPALGKRYVRLALPYAAALALAIVVNEIVRTAGFDHESVSATPTWRSVLAHLALLHSIGGFESLSAGVWYVAIDFQLYGLVLLWFWLCRRAGVVPTTAQAVVATVTAASLWWWNRHAALDVWALYFVGSHGLGMMAWWASRSPQASHRLGWTLALAIIGCVALVIEWRTRIAVALAMALLVVVAAHARWPRRVRRWHARPLSWVGERSYSIFLIHFPVSLLVNAGFHLQGYQGVYLNGVGMLLAVSLSLAAGSLLHRFTEVPAPTWPRWARWRRGPAAAKCGPGDGVFPDSH
ncbi:acyltransferase family protein [Ramlibacter aurantiacus]|uniref:acyltransferase family protein n=1 Tax=Ramlibacter aurantiacus TaxID=2801330 RepID=UPI0033902BA9